MFEATLKDHLEKIFDMRATFDTPGDSMEQERIFIQVTQVLGRVVDGRQIARVVGNLRVFAQIDKMPFGYFAKRIAAAAPELTRHIFFEREETQGTHRNIVEHTVPFTFLFDSQYDPPRGQITTLQFTEGYA